MMAASLMCLSAIAIEEDKAIIYPILELMDQVGFRLWYDQGIESSSEWPKVVAKHLQKSSTVLFCLSKNFTASTNCLDELFYAKDNIPNRITLFLNNNLQLAVELQLALVRQQKIYLANYRDNAELVTALKKEPQIQDCLCATSPAQKAINLNVDRIRRDLQDETFLAGNQAYANCDFKQAMDLYRTSYFGGNSTAGTLLAKMYYYGHYCPQDYDRAVQIFIDCMHRDNPLASEEVSDCYLYGHGVPKDKEKACVLFSGCQDALEEMAILGSSNAQYALGYDILYGKFTAPTPERGVYWLQKAAESGSNVAMFHLAKARLTGNGCPKDRDTAVRELNHCKNDPHCAYLIANLMQKGIEGIIYNYSTAFEFLLNAAEKGHIQAQGALGDCYYEGKGTRVDYTQAILWYQKAADKGDLYSIGHLGMQYLLAEGVPKDIEKAISFFTTADKKTVVTVHACWVTSIAACMMEKNPTRICQKLFAVCREALTAETSLHLKSYWNAIMVSLVKKYRTFHCTVRCCRKILKQTALLPMNWETTALITTPTVWTHLKPLSLGKTFKTPPPPTSWAASTATASAFPRTVPRPRHCCARPPTWAARKPLPSCGSSGSDSLWHQRYYDLMS